MNWALVATVSIVRVVCQAKTGEKLGFSCWISGLQQCSQTKKITFLYIIILVNQNFAKVIETFKITYVSQLGAKLSKNDLKSKPPINSLQ